MKAVNDCKILYKYYLRALLNQLNFIAFIYEDWQSENNETDLGRKELAM